MTYPIDSALLIIGLVATAVPAQGELKKLEGTWALVSAEQDGQVVTSDAVQAARLYIAGATHTVQVGKESTNGTHKLDPTAVPKAIDSTDQGKILLGIYELRGDEFRVCFAAPGKDRPTEFSTKTGTGHILHVWKRQ
jgi:uncharacterized protein (TIGR03067 family)